ncbi:hypothetical protein C8Q80DRAFT_1267583 [Daedaleopsis nitida]|nr:hypothetical protein C8Q80DRAFT_1267583 [Daedaleopsis nitida]
MSPGLLYVPGEPGPNLPDAEWNDWYDNEHVPLRMAIPTIQSTSRWTAADGEQPTYLAMYDLDSCAVLSEPPYNTLASTASEREKSVFQRVQLLDRRTYDLLEPTVLPPAAGYDASEPGPYLITMQIEVKPELEDDLNRWYREEHVGLLAKVPGWRRTRRFVLKDVGPAKGSDAGKMAERGRPPKYMAVHEWESPASFDTPEFKHATSTPWRMRMFESADAWDRRFYKLMRAWTQ